MSSANTLINSLDDDKKQIIENDFNKWYQVILEEYKEMFGTSESQYININDKSVAIIFFREAIAFWNSKKPRLQVINEICENKEEKKYIKFSNLNDIYKIKICDTQITNLYKQMNLCNITISELELVNFVK